jgi:hypothetical protein
MNETLIAFARGYLRQRLSKCTDGEQLIFKRMYSNDNLDISIDEVVERMDVEKLDWGVQQVERTLKKHEKEKDGG